MILRFVSAEREGFEPPELSLNCFQDSRLKPLGHLSPTSTRSCGASSNPWREPGKVYETGRRPTKRAGRRQSSAIRFEMVLWRDGLFERSQPRSDLAEGTFARHGAVFEDELKFVLSRVECRIARRRDRLELARIASNEFEATAFAALG